MKCLYHDGFSSHIVQPYVVFRYLFKYCVILELFSEGLSALGSDEPFSFVKKVFPFQVDKLFIFVFAIKC